MENGADADFGHDLKSNAASHSACGWLKWPAVRMGLKRSISWNGFTANRRPRAASPNFFDDIDDVIEKSLSPDLFRSPSNTPSSSTSIISATSQNSFHDDQSITSRRFNDIFDDSRDAIHVSSPASQSIDSQEPQGSEELFSSMDVGFDTKSVDLFSDCETTVDITEQRTGSPDLFSDSDSSEPESVDAPLPIDLTQDENEMAEQNQNGPGVSEEGNEIVPLVNSIQPQGVVNLSQEAAAAGDVDNHASVSQHSQLIISEQRLRMLCDPNILLERFLGSPVVNNAPNSAAVQDHFNDDATTNFSGDDVSVLDIDDEAKECLCKIERFIEDTLKRLSDGKQLELNVRNRTNWSNCAFKDDIFSLLPQSQAKYRRIRSTYWISLVFYLLGEIYELISLKRTCTTRELYYSDTSITQKQENVNEAMKLICCKLEVSPWQLGVMSSTKGLLAGKVKIFMPENVVIDCSLHTDGILLPHCTSVIERITTEAKYVLLVEKDTVFKKLVQYDISKHFGTECLLITGKGYPDTNTRLMLKKIWDSHRLPIYALTDADPHGIEIMLTYRHGSLAMSNLSDVLAVPYIRWIGILPSDIQKFGIKSIPMTGEDRRKLENLMKRPGVNDNVFRELQWLQRTDEKAEIEGLSGSSTHYLIDVYLRNQFVNEIAI